MWDRAEVVRQLVRWVGHGEAGAAERARAWAEVLRQPRSTWTSRASMDPGHVTASALVTDPGGDSVVLIEHRALARWLQPGGHLEATDASLFAAARREAEEETGLEGLVPGGAAVGWLDLDVHEIPGRPSRGEGVHRHFDVRFHLVADAARDLAPDSSVAGAAWRSLTSLDAHVTDESVLGSARLLQAWRARRARVRSAHAPAALRNREAIANVLADEVVREAHVLEVGCGTGEHAAFLAEVLDVARWVPTDRDRDALARATWSADESPRISAPQPVDVEAPSWPGVADERYDHVYSANLIHIAPWTATWGLLSGAWRALRPGGTLWLYGPFHEHGRATAPSNAAFDESLRARDPRWGVRDQEAVIDAAAAVGFVLRRVVSMPANNRLIVLERSAVAPSEAPARMAAAWQEAWRTEVGDERRVWGPRAVDLAVWSARWRRRVVGAGDDGGLDPQAADRLRRMDVPWAGWVTDLLVR